MKKTFKLMLAFVLVALCSTSAWAVKTVGDTFTNGYYNYEVTKVSGNTLDAFITGIKEGQKSNVNVAETLAIPGTFNLADGETNYTVNVIGWDEETFWDLTSITGISIPATVKSIPQNAFKGCTEVKTITFAANSQVEVIGKYAFGATKISNFDFTPCVKLRELSDYVFVSGPTSKNSFVTNVTVPTSPYFKHINRAFVNLTKLAAINNLGESYVEEIVSSAFENTPLPALSFPGTVKWIAKDALAGMRDEFDSNKLKLASLTIDVTSMESLGGGTITVTENYDATKTYSFNAEVATKNLFNAESNNTLKYLTLKGQLRGKIAQSAFLNCTALLGNDNTKVLNLSETAGFSIGSTGTIEPFAFGGCTSIEALKVCDITDNERPEGYTIQQNAFNKCKHMATVTIGKIIAKRAIETNAFSECVDGNKGLNTFTVGDISANATQASDAAIGSRICFGSTNLATVTIGNITGNYAISANAFVTKDNDANSVKTVTIGNIDNAISAVGATAFGNNLKDVVIGRVSANGTAIVTNAFVWGNNNASTLTIALGSGQYISQTSASLEDPAIDYAAFNMAAIQGNIPGFNTWPVIKIGEILSKGGAFAGGVIVAPKEIKELTFEGPIADNGLVNTADEGGASFLSYEGIYRGLTAITFNGALGINAVPTAIFSNCDAIKTFNFNGVMAGKAVGAGAFNVPEMFDNKPNVANIYLTYDGNFDYTKNPFDNHAFDMYATDDRPRFILLNLLETPTANAALLNAEFQNTDYGIGQYDIVKGLYMGTLTTPADYFDIFLVKFYTAPDAGYIHTFPVYANNDALGEAWGRYDDFGKWAVDGRAETYAFASFGDADCQTAYGEGTVKVLKRDATSARIQVLTNEPAEGVNPEDAARFVGETYLIQYTKDDYTFDGVYELYDALDTEFEDGLGVYVEIATDANPDWPYHSVADIDITKGVKIDRYQKAYADGTEAYENAKKDGGKTKGTVDVKVTLYGVYTDEDKEPGLSTVYMVPLKVKDGYYWISKDNAKTVVAKVTPVSGSFAANTTYHINWADETPDYPSVWTELPEANDFKFSKQVDTHEQLWDVQDDAVHSVQANIWEDGTKYTTVDPDKVATQALFVMSDPSKYHGVTINRITFQQGNNAFLGQGWYFTFLKSWGVSAEKPAAGKARIVWLDTEEEATAIFALKNEVAAEGANGTGLINMQGVEVNENYQGLVIDKATGKKFYQNIQK